MQQTSYPTDRSESSRFTRRYRQLVRISAIYDLVATAAFSTPWTFAVLLRFLGTLSPLPTFEPLHVMFVNLLGSLVMVWSILRIVKPEPLFGLYDSIARGLFFFWQMYYLLAMHGTLIVAGFAVFEFGFGVVQAYGYGLLQKIPLHLARQPPQPSLPT